MKPLTIDRVVKGIIIIVAVVILLYLVFTFMNLVAYALVALILSYMLDPLVNRLQAYGLNRTLGILLVLTLVGFIVAGVSTTIFPTVGQQIVELTKQLNLKNIQMVAQKMDLRLNALFPFIPYGFLQQHLTALAQQIFNVAGISTTISNIIGFFTNVFAALLVIPFATFFFLKDGNYFRRTLLRLVPNRYFETTLNIIDKIETRLGLYFKSIALESLLVAILSSFLLTVAGLQNALSVGIAIGIANSIPYFGPILGYGLSVVVAIFETGDFSLVGACLLAVLFTQLVDNVVFQPFLFSRSAGMHPMIILFAILIGAQVAGLIGMLVAIPIATIIKIIVVEIHWSLKNYYVFSQRDS